MNWLLAALAGAAAMYFLDPDRGKRRRALARDRTAATLRRAEETSERLQRRVVADSYGWSQKLTHPGVTQEPPPNDATLKAKVESELFRDPRIPKGSINVNAESGVVQLRLSLIHI